MESLYGRAVDAGVCVPFDGTTASTVLKPRTTVNRWLRRVTWCALLCLSAMAHATNYVYDANGRLVAVSADDGTSAQYAYDNVGNLVQISQVPSGQLALFTFVPTHGTPGTPVTLYGQGFDSSVAGNSVSFNGVAATVASATPNQLVTQVPPGATTGPITVTAKGQTASSSTAFVVDGSGLPPTIDQVTPTVAAIGDTITVTGSHLYPTANETVASIGVVGTRISQATDTQLQLVVPSTSGSGYVTVQTPYGRAQSASPILALPAGMSAANVTSTGTTTVGGSPVALNISAGGQIGALMFDGTAGSWVSLQLSGIVTTAKTLSYKVYAPSNGLVLQGTVSSTSASIHLPKLTIGTYTVLFQPDTAGAQFSVTVEQNVGLVESALTPVATASAGQSKRVVLQARQGDNLELSLSGLVVQGGGLGATVYVYGPTGVTLASPYCYTSNPNGNCLLHLWNLSAGTYTAVVVPTGTASTLSANLKMTRDLVGTITPDSPLNLSLQTGQVQRLTFNANAGDTIGLQLASIATNPANQSVSMFLYRPDVGTITTSTAAYANISSSTDAVTNLANLPVSGTYTLIVVPSYGVAATAQAQVLSGLPISPDGASQNFVASTPNQSAYLKFTANAGDNLELSLSGLTVRGDGTGATVYVYGPTGAVVASPFCNTSNPGGDCLIHLWNLSPGTYTSLVVPNGSASTLSVNLKVTRDLVGAITPDSPLNLSLQTGQVQRLTFNANAGDTIGLQLANIATNPANQNARMMLYRPDVGTITTSTATYANVPSSTNAVINLSNLPVSGTYTLIVEQDYGVPMTLQAQVMSGLPITPDGANQNFVASTPNQSAYFKFAANAGDNMELSLNGLTVGGGSTGVTVYVYGPTGAVVASPFCNTSNPNGDCLVHLWNLSAGTYTALLVPNGSGGTPSLNLRVTRDLVGAITPDSPLNLSLQLGQVQRLTFNANAGDTIGLQLANIITTPANVTVRMYLYRPDVGAITASTTAYANLVSTIDALANLSNLPVGGTYTLIVVPDYGVATTGVVSALSGLREPWNFAALVPSQSAYLTFVADGNYSLDISLNNITIQNGSTGASIYVYGPTGATVASTGGCTATSLPPGGTCLLHLGKVAAGTYSAWVVPGSYAGKMGFQGSLIRTP